MKDFYQMLVVHDKKIMTPELQILFGQYKKPKKKTFIQKLKNIFYGR